MKLLLDTHIALWSLTDSPLLGREARELIASPDSQVAVSAASIWEIAIKFRLKRGRPNDMPISGGEAFAQFKAANFTILFVTPEHAVAVDDLPPHHGDPFDRMLVAQALTEPMHLLTRDARLKDYGALIRVL